MDYYATTTRQSLSLVGLDTPVVRHGDTVVTPLRRGCKERHACALSPNQPISHTRICIDIDLR
jgi:hypothetical protein